MFPCLVNTRLLRFSLESKQTTVQGSAVYSQSDLIIISFPRSSDGSSSDFKNISLPRLL